MAAASNPSGPEPPRGAGIAVRAPGGGKVKKLLSMGGTFLTVAVLTGLLWVWADQSQLLIQEIDDLSFVLATGADSSLVLLSVDDGSKEADADPATGGSKRVEAKVSFRGTRSRLRELQADLQSGRLELLSYLSEGRYWADEHKIAVAGLLDANDELRDRGVTVVKAEPANITVELDEWVRIEKIKLVLKDTRFRARIDPPEIAVQVPSSRKDTLPKELPVELGAVPDKITTEETVSGTVSRELQGTPVKPERSKVMVTLLPKKQSKISLGQMEIRVSVPANMFGTYKLTWKDPARKFVGAEVEGPFAELNKLKSASQKKVRAYIDLGSEHAKATEAFYEVTVRFEFDDDIRGVEILDLPKTVRVRLEKKLPSYE